MKGEGHDDSDRETDLFELRFHRQHQRGSLWIGAAFIAVGLLAILGCALAESVRLLLLASLSKKGGLVILGAMLLPFVLGFAFLNKASGHRRKAADIEQRIRPEERGGNHA